MLERTEHVVNSPRRILPRVRHPLHLRIDRLPTQIDQILHEVVRGLGLDVPAFQLVLWEVLEVLGDYDLRVHLDRRGKYMAVVGIRQIDDVDQLLVSGDEDVGDRSVHQFARATEFVRIEVGTVLLEVAKGLIEDPLGPLRLDQTACATRMSRSRTWFG